MDKVTYSEKLRNPRWQKKRLEIFESDGWACVFCGNKDKTLVCHHRYYLLGKEPWDYPNEALVTLCEDCHQLEAEYRSQSESEILMVLKAWSLVDIDKLTDAIGCGEITPHTVWAPVIEFLNGRVASCGKPTD